MRRTAPGARASCAAWCGEWAGGPGAGRPTHARTDTLRRLGSGGASTVMVSEGAAMSKGGQATSLVANIKKGRHETRNTEHYGERDEDDRGRNDRREEARSKTHGRE